jgi:hypothetical protein
VAHKQNGARCDDYTTKRRSDLIEWQLSSHSCHQGARIGPRSLWLQTLNKCALNNVLQKS